MTATQTTTRELDQQFLDDVASDVRNTLKDPLRLQAVRSPQVAEKRLSALLYLKSGVESQLAAQKGRLAKASTEMEEEEWLPYRAEQLDWRGKAIRFLSAIEKDMLKIKSKLGFGGSDCCAEAIAAHEESLDNDDIEPSEADLALWKHLDEHDE